MHLRSLPGHNQTGVRQVFWSVLILRADAESPKKTVRPYALFAALYARLMASKLVCILMENSLNLGMTFRTPSPLTSRYLAEAKTCMPQNWTSNTPGFNTTHMHKSMSRRHRVHLSPSTVCWNAACMMQAQRWNSPVVAPVKLHTQG